MRKGIMEEYLTNMKKKVHHIIPNIDLFLGNTRKKFVIVKMAIKMQFHKTIQEASL
jgi:hypothetical protein